MFTGYGTLYESSLCYKLCSWLYPVEPIPAERTKELKVICLGLPRSGTESLSFALQHLGYDKVSHGMIHFWLNNADTAKLWYELALLRAQGRLPEPEISRTKYFDRMLGDCEATTDIPSVWFAAELLMAYPDAKVVLNKRKDTAAWKSSFRASILPIMKFWRYWFWSWFESELFWTMGLTYWLHSTRLFKGDFEAHAEEAYEDHYMALENLLDQNKRSYLRWSVEDGWDNLCEYLERPVPSEPFPDGNKASEFMPKVMACDRARFAKAEKNAISLFSIFAIAVASGTVLAKLKQ